MGAGKSKLSADEIRRREMSRMNLQMKEKFNKTVRYDMRVVIKGDRNVGKTCLLRRLEGRPFIENYIPTREIQVGSIEWEYEKSGDNVRVEVWDIVDHGRSESHQKKKETLVLQHNKREMEEEVSDEEKDESIADARSVNVYRSAHAVLLMFDITKPWTLEYVTRTLPEVPRKLPVVLLANGMDRYKHRTVTKDEVMNIVKKSKRERIIYLESSMMNCFGLKELYSYFSVPFLLLKRRELESELRNVESELECEREGASVISDGQNYEEYLDQWDNARKQRRVRTSAPTAAQTPTRSVEVTNDEKEKKAPIENKNKPTVEVTKKEESRKECSHSTKSHRHEEKPRRKKEERVKVKTDFDDFYGEDSETDEETEAEKYRTLDYSSDEETSRVVVVESEPKVETYKAEESVPEASEELKEEEVEDEKSEEIEEEEEERYESDEGTVSPVISPKSVDDDEELSPTSPPIQTPTSHPDFVPEEVVNFEPPKEEGLDDFFGDEDEEEAEEQIETEQYTTIADDDDELDSGWDAVVEKKESPKSVEVPQEVLEQARRQAEKMLQEKEPTEEAPRRHGSSEGEKKKRKHGRKEGGSGEGDRKRHGHRSHHRRHRHKHHKHEKEEENQ